MLAFNKSNVSLKDFKDIYFKEIINDTIIPPPIFKFMVKFTRVHFTDKYGNSIVINDKKSLYESEIKELYYLIFR
jgi:hypothetical protein